VPNLDFYGPRTAHGSSLSPAITASPLARGGRSDEALPMLRRAVRLDLYDLTGTTAAGLYIATMGGVWPAMLTGFAGVRVADRVLTVEPQLARGRERDLSGPHGWPASASRNSAAACSGGTVVAASRGAAELIWRRVPKDPWAERPRRTGPKPLWRRRRGGAACPQEVAHDVRVGVRL
jgi:hypothetical protein